MIFSRQFLIYASVGVASATIDIGLMKFLIANDINYLFAATLGFTAGLTFNFCLHTWVTFRSRYSHSALIKYLLVVLVNYALTLTSISSFHHLFGMPVLGKIISLPLVAINGFLLIKYWVHKPSIDAI
ncbi:GtrA family protein [Comamonas sp.]|uniref:GtrA family protein n=1 Tax=Comamonas sp. TaxID=34028 RepID=UPI0039174A0D